MNHVKPFSAFVQRAVKDIRVFYQLYVRFARVQMLLAVMGYRFCNELYFFVFEIYCIFQGILCYYSTSFCMVFVVTFYN